MPKLLNLLASLNPDEILVDFLKASIDVLRESLKTIFENSLKFKDVLTPLAHPRVSSR